MFRKHWFAPALACVLLAAAVPATAQERRSRLDVVSYAIDAEVHPNTQSLSAKVTVQFIPVDDNTTSAVFELNNALNVSRVVDAAGKQIPASRSQQDFSVRLSFDQPLPKGQPQTLTFFYDGRLTGQEESPVYGIKFAAIQSDYAYLMYPARWFPISGYTTDRFAANIRVTAPQGFKVIGSGLESTQTAGDKVMTLFQFERPSFPGSIAVLKDEAVKVPSEGVTTALFFRGAEKTMANVYGQEIGKIMAHFTGLFGLPPYANLTVVETENGAPNGYAAPGLLFLNPRAIGSKPNGKLLANQISRQWFEELVSPATRNHLWLTNGLAAYSEMLWVEHTAGPGAMESAYRDVMVESLTIDNVPIIQSARLEDYSPELWALTGSKGAAVFHMLRYVIGDEKFFAALKEYTHAFAWKIDPHGRFPQSDGSGGQAGSRATSSFSGSNRAAPPNSSSSTRFSAP